MLELTPAEESRFASAVEALLDHFDSMSAFPIDGLQPMAHVAYFGNRTRPDEPRSHSGDPDTLLDSAPDLEDRYIAIPNVL